MTKIGIITYPDISDGKGRFLQAYALYSFLKSEKFDVEIIDYQKENTESSINKILRRIKKISISNVIEYISLQNEKKHMSKIAFERVKQRNKYINFINEQINMSVKINEIESLVSYSKQFDVIVCGSDQIWNPYYWGKDSVYYASFVPKYKRISYAASIGTTSIDDDSLHVISKMIASMEHISVREKSASDMLKTRSNIKADTVLDPTFLMSEEWWNSYADSPRLTEDKYLLTFFFDNTITAREFSHKVQKKYQLRNINIPETSMDLTDIDISCPCLSPNEFVSAFKNAEYVITQSFHGVVLSILYRKKFFVMDCTTKYRVKGLSSRFRDLLDGLGLSNRIITGMEDLDEVDTDIDYISVYNKLHVLREYSKKYLISSIKDSVQKGRLNVQKHI